MTWRLASPSPLQASPGLHFTDLSLFISTLNQTTRPQMGDIHPIFICCWRIENVYLNKKKQFILRSIDRHLKFCCSLGLDDWMAGVWRWNRALFNEPFYLYQKSINSNYGLIKYFHVHIAMWLILQCIFALISFHIPSEYRVIWSSKEETYYEWGFPVNGKCRSANRPLS